MPKSDGYKNLEGNGFDKHPERINKKGRPPTLKASLRKLLEKDGSVVFEKKDVISINEDGSVEVKVPERDALMFRLIKIAHSRASNNVRAIQMIMEHLEGKPTQLLEFSEYKNLPTIYIDATEFVMNQENNKEE